MIPDDEGLGLVVPNDETDPTDPDSADSTIRGGRTLAAPWRWERLIVESSVIGGADRWKRRLTGLAEELRARIRGIQDEDPDDPRIDRIARELDDLSHLQVSGGLQRVPPPCFLFLS